MNQWKTFGLVKEIVLLAPFYRNTWILEEEYTGDSIPIGYSYSIFTYIYHANQLNVGKYTSPMDPLGFVTQLDLIRWRSFICQFVPIKTNSNMAN